MVLIRRSPSSSPAAAAPPNILLITLDTTRADHLGAYGATFARTPNLDRLASEGVLFERAISAAPVTLPAHVSLLTGRYPFAHGVRNNGNFRLAETVPTLHSLLHDRGYDTAAFVSAYVLDRRTGLARGFDTYDDHLDSAGGRASDEDLERRGDRTALAARSWLSDRAARAPASRRPFFLWVHLYDPHDPYTPPPPFDAPFPDRPYDGEIAFDDDVIGSVLADLDRLGMRSSTIVAIAGDHGESLGEHGEETHAMFVYDAVLRVPMMIRWPGHLAPARFHDPVRSVDLAPTLVELAGLPPLVDVQGSSLLPVGRHDRTASPTLAYAETYFPLFFMNWAPLRSIEDDRWKFVDAPVPELYDLANDPAERSNLATQEPGRAGAMRRALESASGGGAGAMSTAKPNADALRKLAALGYVSATPGAPVADAASRPDPKALIGVFNRLRAANSDMRTGRAAAAEATAREVLAQDRRNAFAQLILGRAEAQQGRCREAIDAYRQYAALVPSSADPHYWSAICHARLDEQGRALDEASAALAIDPMYVSALVLRAGLLTELGHLEDAAVDYRRALELQPSNANAHSGYGVLLAARQEPDRAIAEFEHALELRGDLGDVRLALAGLLERAGRAAEAQAQYERIAADARATPQTRRSAHERLARMSK
jgi:arylsulfatase A-like enzyme/Tfp pilus assembly protein PilF